MRTFRITLILSILLIVGGFVCPPIGVIDSSVLTAVGMLLAFAILAQIPTLIEAAKGGKTIRLQKGDFSAEVSSENDCPPTRNVLFPFIPHRIRVADTIM